MVISCCETLVSSNWIVRNVSKTACVTIFKSNVTFFTPFRTPRVLDNPSTFLETNKENSVVVGIVVAFREDTTSVVTPIRGINGDSNGLLFKSSCECSSGGLNLLVARDWVSWGKFGGCDVAFAINSSVRIVALSCDRVGLDVSEGCILVTTTTAVVTVSSSSAINELLLRKIDGLFSFVSDNQSGFDGSSCGESPARTARSLVFNSSDFVCSHPVNVNGGIDINILGDGFSIT